MTKYLNPNLVKESFVRLSSKSGEGKSHLERTSAILYFLAFDAACQSTQKVELDLDPDRLEGRNNRKQLELEFVKLVLLHNLNGNPIQIFEFGKVDYTNISPEKRISANFLTVPLKKATTHTEPYYYPKRPNAPLLNMGLVATKKKWGMMRNENFAVNIFTILNTARSSTPAFDLSVLVLRDTKFPSSQQDIFSALSEQLPKKFTPEVAQLLSKRIDKEKVLIRTKFESFIDHYSNFINLETSNKVSDDPYKNMSREDLIAIIQELEASVHSLTKNVKLRKP